MESLQRVPVGDGRERFLPLLLLADESERQVRSYMQRGDLYVYANDAVHEPAGVVLVIAAEDGVVELKAVAVAPHLQGQGLGLRMVRAVLADLRARGVRRVIVGTANAGIGQLAYYQKAGFRLLRIERDFFLPERGYPPHMEANGIRLRDMVWMDLELDDPAHVSPQADSVGR
jgi:ribosomal protein S18 acetylase RimI-like enzyme